MRYNLQRRKYPDGSIALERVNRIIQWYFFEINDVPKVPADDERATIDGGWRRVAHHQPTAPLQFRCPSRRLLTQEPPRKSRPHRRCRETYQIGLERLSVQVQSNLALTLK